MDNSRVVVVVPPTTGMPLPGRPRTAFMPEYAVVEARAATAVERASVDKG